MTQRQVALFIYYDALSAVVLQWVFKNRWLKGWP